MIKNPPHPKTRQVVLSGGPYDGAKMLVSGSSLIVLGELYVSDENDHFCHALTEISKLPEDDMQRERATILDWLNLPNTPKSVIPPEAVPKVRRDAYVLLTLLKKI